MDPDADDLYERLGVSPDASQKEIRRRASRVERRFGEKLDGATGEKREELLRQYERLKEARQVLKDRERRTKYDERRADGTADTGGADGEAGDTEDTDTEDTDIDTGGGDDWSDSEVVPLTISTDRSRVPQGESVTVRIGTPSDIDLDWVYVELSGAEFRRERVEGGETTIRLDEPGTVEFTVKRDDDSYRRYESGNAEVTVLPRVSLNLDVSESRVPAGSTVTVSVEDDDGTPLEGITVTGHDDDDRPVDEATTEDGEADLSFPSPGDKYVRADPDDDDVVYDGDEEEIVAYRPSLTITADPETGDTESAITFEVTREDGSVPEATVDLSGETATTDEDGRVEHTFEEPGRYTVEASKEDPVRHDPDTVEVEVFPPTAGPLSVTCDPSAVTVGDEITVEVSYGDEPVDGAMVSLADEEFVVETEDGSCVLPTDDVESRGRTEVVVETERGDEKRAEVLLNAPSTAGTESDTTSSTGETASSGRGRSSTSGGGLGLTTPSDTVTADGEPVEFTITHGGGPASGATLQIINEGTGQGFDRTANERGKVMFGFTESGNYEVRAYHDVRGTQHSTSTNVRVTKQADGGDGAEEGWPPTRTRKPWWEQFRERLPYVLLLLLPLGAIAVLTLVLPLEMVLGALAGVGAMAGVVWVLTKFV